MTNGTFKRVADGIYKLRGHFYHRPYNPNGNRTFRALEGVTLKAAKANLARTENPDTGLTIGEAVRNYRAADCPDKRRAPRIGVYLDRERVRCDTLLRYWGPVKCSELTSAMIDDYADWRIRQTKGKNRHGGRSADLDIVVLRNALRWAARRGTLRENPFERITVSSYRGSKIRHCRESAPASGDELHSLAAHLFESKARGLNRHALAWLTLITAMVGCRISEMTALRVDAKEGEPGSISDGILWLRRKKKGANNFFRIHEDLADCLKHFFAWRRTAKGLDKSPWWFPGRDPMKQLSEQALTHALRKAGKALGCGPRTAHGLRSFYVTCRRSAGISDAEIALETGQISGGREIVKTYGDATPKKISWLPSEAQPAWVLYQSYTTSKRSKQVGKTPKLRVLHGKTGDHRTLPVTTRKAAI